MNQEDNLLGKWIAILHRYRKNYVNRKLEAYGFSGGQFIILLTLARHDGASQEAISQCIKIDKTTTAKSLKKLESNGYILRKQNPADKRAYNVFLTPKAASIMPLIYQVVTQWEAQVTSGLSEEEYQLIEKALQKMANNACDLLKNAD